MSQTNWDLDDLGRNIQDIIDRAVNSRDFQQLNQTIRQAVDRAVDAGSDAVRTVVDSVPRQKTVTVEKKPLPVLYGKTGGRTAVGVLKVIGGGLVSGAAMLALVSGLIVDLLITGTTALGIGTFLTLAGFGAGVGLIGSGASNLSFVSRFKAYRRTLGQKTQCTLEQLARSVGKSVKFVRREVQKMISQGLFLEGHLDKEQTRLITSHETYRYFEQSRLQLEARQRQEEAVKLQRTATANHTPQVQDVLDRGNAFVDQIRRCNDAIPGHEISAKISRMEIIVQRIFDRAQAHPEIVPDLKKLMDYYLPMTVKLLNAYADMDAQPVQGETIQASKKEIEGTLDTLNAAFEKLLDELFADTAMDVSSDISVLHTLLAQEGLTEDDLTKMKKSM